MAKTYNKIKLVLLISLFSLFFVHTAYGGTFFVDTNGNNSGDGRFGSPWKTIAYALANAQYGDIISINNGTYSERQLVVPAGVSLTSTSKDNTKVKVQPNTSLNTRYPFILLSSSPGTNGNQTISYIEVDGRNGANVAYVGIGVKSRNNVRIHHCNIHDFYGTYHAACVEVQSTQTSPTDEWWTLWPADPQAPGTDTNIDALWPLNPVVNFELDNNTISDGGYYTDAPDYRVTAAVALWNLKNSTIHHNAFDMTVSKGQYIGGRGLKTAMLWNVDVYNNTGTMGEIHRLGSQFMYETWVHRGGCEFYNNTGEGCYSITIGKETKIYDNVIELDPPATIHGIGVEFNVQSYGEISRNVINGSMYGMTLGLGEFTNVKDWKCEYVTVKKNTVYNFKKIGIWILAHGANMQPQSSTVRHINVYDNVIDGQTSEERGDEYHRGESGIVIKQKDNVGTCSISNVTVKNNVGRDITGYPGKTIGTVSNLVIDRNTFYGNTYNSWNGSNATNTITTFVTSDLPPPAPIGLAIK